MISASTCPYPNACSNSLAWPCSQLSLTLFGRTRRPCSCSTLWIGTLETSWHLSTVPQGAGLRFLSNPTRVESTRKVASYLIAFAYLIFFLLIFLTYSSRSLVLLIYFTYLKQPQVVSCSALWYYLVEGCLIVSIRLYFDIYLTIQRKEYSFSPRLYFNRYVFLFCCEMGFYLFASS